eukprot:2264386-Pleurochrysis_carterae.AAC.2
MEDANTLQTEDGGEMLMQMTLRRTERFTANDARFGTDYDRLRQIAKGTERRWRELKRKIVRHAARPLETEHSGDHGTEVGKLRCPAESPARRRKGVARAWKGPGKCVESAQKGPGKCVESA